MDNLLEFTNFITKGIEIEKSEGRVFTGHLTVEVVDKQNEFIAIDEIIKAMKNYMELTPNISDFHSNRMVGKMLAFEKSEYKGHPSVKAKIRIHKQEGTLLYDQVWEKIKSGEYKGLSIGGAAKTKIPIIKNGKMYVMLKDLEIYEFAVCPNPANQLAVIDYVNDIAKAMDNTEMLQDRNGRNVIQCDSVVCQFEKGTNLDNDIDADNIQPYQIKEIREKQKEHSLQIKKLYEISKPIRGHDWAYWDKELESEYPDKETRSKVIGAMEYKDKSEIEKKDYPWGECTEDQKKRGESQESADKICGSIKYRNKSLDTLQKMVFNYTPQGVIKKQLKILIQKYT